VSSIRPDATAGPGEAWPLEHAIPLGPEGFDVTVTSLDLRPGGDLIYLMTAGAGGLHEAGEYAANKRMPGYLHRGLAARPTGLYDFGRFRAWRRALGSRHYR
jgi:hypothetical protein